MQKIMPHSIMTMLLSLLVLSMLGVSASAQSDCGNPFAGENIRFNVDYWTKTDFCQRSVPLSTIRSGGPPPDGIPPIDEPKFQSIAEAEGWLQAQSPVIAFELDGNARAYPLAILTWHEIVNDEVAGVPIAVTFCPLCNASVVFDRRMPDVLADDADATVVLRLGVSGNLRNSDLIMWDHYTESWWQQLTGEGIVGAYTGSQLTALPSLMVGFADFVARYPDGVVLAPDTGYNRSYGSNPYERYDSTTRPFLFEGELDTRLPATERVLGSLVNNVPVAYPFPVLAERRAINDVVDGVAVVAFWQDGMVSALDARTIDNSRVVGTAALYYRVVDDRMLTFRVDDDGLIRDEQTGSIWNVFGLAEAGELTGTQLLQEVAGPHFWFAWAAFKPETIIYGLE